MRGGTKAEEGSTDIAATHGNGTSSDHRDSHWSLGLVTGRLANTLTAQAGRNGVLYFLAGTATITLARARWNS